MTDHITLPRSVVEFEKLPFEHWAKDLGYDTAHTYDTDRSRWVWLSPMTADLWASWLARAALAGTARAEPVVEIEIEDDGDNHSFTMMPTQAVLNLPLGKYSLYTEPQPAQPVLDLDCVCGASWEHRHGQWEMVDTPHAPRPAQPVAVTQGYKITEEMHAAACKVLHRATGLDGLPQRMLDAMLNAAPTPPAATVPVLEPLTDAEYQHLARGTCSAYKSGKKTDYMFTFLPQNLENFVRAVEAAHAAKLAKLNGITPPAEGGV